VTVRLVLWDVDHTLLELGRLHYQLYRDAFQFWAGRAPEHLVDMSGRTDRDSMIEMLQVNAVEPSEQHLVEFSRALINVLDERADKLPESGHPLPGAEAALAALKDTPGVLQSVLTGNLKPLAVGKLTAFGFDKFLDFDIGGYGWDHVERGRLVDIARSRATEKYGAVFDATSTILIGDTPRDIEAAHVGGAVAVAVATGLSSPAELEAAGADRVLPDLGDTGAVVRAVLDTYEAEGAEL
jgi:phosphoglycolate phosphatase-like HAD superfamily hydrolase